MCSLLIRSIRWYSTRQNQRCLYDILDVKNSATAKEIRTAFIRLSKIHHPDREKGDLVKFQELSNAYEVLRNDKLREIYDRNRGDSGLRGRANPFGRPSPTRPQRHETPLYNYDEWLRSHYGETLRKRRQEESARKFAKEFLAQQARGREKLNLQRNLEHAFLLVILFALFIFFKGESVYKMEEMASPFFSFAHEHGV